MTAAAKMNEVKPVENLFGENAFERMDESDDAIFYERDRFVQHLDSTALATVEQLIGTLVVEERPAILDLMASWDSHIPARLSPSRLVGLGLNARELAENPRLTERVVHDLNKNPSLPFPAGTFDAVVNTVSVDYMTRPVEVFAEVGRILKPGGLFLVIFSNRMFPRKASRVWRQSGENERIVLVEEFFRHAGAFDRPKMFLSKGMPRPEEDKYFRYGIPSDPVYAVYAERTAEGRAGMRRPDVLSRHGQPLPEQTLKERTAVIKETLQCPHCGERMRKWQVPYTPFTAWDNEFMYICFNDACPYLLQGWEVMSRQGNRGLSYRLMYDPLRDHIMPVPVPSLAALRDGIVE